MSAPLRRLPVRAFVIAVLCAGCSEQPAARDAEQALDRLQPVQRLAGPFAQPATAVAWSLDGRYLAAGGLDGTLRVWSVRTGQQIAAAADFARPYSPDSMAGVGFASDGTLAFGSADGSLQVWRWSDGSRPRRLEGRHSSPVTVVAFSPDGRRLASVAGGTRYAEKGQLFVPYGPLIVHDMGSGRIVSTVRDLADVVNLAIMPDASAFASVLVGEPPLVGADGELRLRAASDGRVLTRIKFNPAVVGTRLFVSPDGTRLFADQAVWNAANGARVSRSPVVGHVFSEDGRMLLSLKEGFRRHGSAEETWARGRWARFETIDAETGDWRAGPWAYEYVEVDGMIPEVYSPDRRMVIDRTLRIWPVIQY